MEDSHTAELQLDEDNRTKNAFFAVYDGHGGMWFPVVAAGRIISNLRRFGFSNMNRSERSQVRGHQRLQTSGRRTDLQGRELPRGSEDGVFGDRRGHLEK